jgi:ABC-type Fe3+-hydroxamate transport system substrate-binding protein
LKAVSAIALGLALLASTASAARVVTLSPHLAELVCAAGACDQLIAVSAYSDYPPQVKQLPLIGDGYSISYEKLVALKPDRVFAWNSGTPPATVARLRELGLRVDVIAASRVDDVATALETIGSVLGTRSAAQAAANSYRDRLARLRTQWRNASPLRVVYQLGTAPAYSINAHSPISDALALCGGVNVFADMPQIAAPIGAEAMIAAKPDVVLYGAGEDGAAMQAYWAKLPGAAAGTNRMLYAVNADWLSRATPRLLDGVEQVCGVLDQARQRLDAMRRVP